MSAEREHQLEMVVGNPWLVWRVQDVEWIGGAQPFCDRLYRRLEALVCC